MARGVSLALLIQGVQEEISSSSLPSQGNNFRDVIKSRIRREYARLYSDFDWPHLRVWRDKAVVAGQRYYDFPTDGGLKIETVRRVYQKWGGEWNEVEPGLDVLDYNGMDSDSDARADPIQKWRPYEEQIEVWPIPASASTLRFVAQKAFNPLVDEADTADLDDNLIILFAAAKLLARRKADEAGLVLAEAQAHYKSLRATPGGPRTFNLAAGGQRGGRFGTDDKTLIGVTATQE